MMRQLLFNTLNVLDYLIHLIFDSGWAVVEISNYLIKNLILLLRIFLTSIVNDRASHNGSCKCACLHYLTFSETDGANAWILWAPAPILTGL